MMYRQFFPSLMTETQHFPIWHLLCILANLVYDYGLIVIIYRHNVGENFGRSQSFIDHTIFVINWIAYAEHLFDILRFSFAWAVIK